MKVTLLEYQPIDLAEFAASVCVGHENDTHYLRNRDLAEGYDTVKGMYAAINSQHYGILEHIHLSWYVEGISRACSHQLVRHRLASYCQQSQRYCKIGTMDREWYNIPPSFNSKDEAMIDYFNLMDQIARTYDKFISTYNIPKEDARFILPNACKTNIMITMNARSFIEASSKRLCRRAQWEIRELFSMMTNTLKDYVPAVYDLCNPPCVHGKCPEKKSCGRPFRTHEDALQDVSEG